MKICRKPLYRKGKHPEILAKNPKLKLGGEDAYVEISFSATDFDNVNSNYEYQIKLSLSELLEMIQTSADDAQKLKVIREKMRETFFENSVKREVASRIKLLQNM